MTVEEYQQQIAELGINRGRLVDGFPFDLPGVGTIDAQPAVFKKKRGEIIKPAPHDLTHLNPSNHMAGKRNGAVKKRRRIPGRPYVKVPRNELVVSSTTQLRTGDNESSAPRLP